ncbi:uncharacterized protein L3040_002630 [Drepanopeziza brunnea f. sp. 'multigermtubi']|uniref:uncharacterized protein n=1 Tax=Drepanopeziza brunnea f. sp. 'multigermtubi' TaxID=698441 RepID=UPI002398B932|nr:hypothetical protein L3040_002630 [Drepanopeziza brunnea f. sp. 'multigermtubi']
MLPTISWMLAGAALLTEPISATPADSLALRNYPTTNTTACSPLVDAGLGSILFYPSDAQYNESISSYYSVSVQVVRPTCILRPQTPEEVALAVTTLGQAGGAGWAVAVRGGGHAVFPGAANVEQGVVIDLSVMNATSFEACTSACEICKDADADGGITSVGAGAKWGAVYDEVEKYGMTVAGGRDSDVGVSGLLLGGGFSFHSGRRGLACDGVINYQVVLASGEIVEANREHNTDLFKALKGGSNNLGIVTRFDLNTWPSRGFFGGTTAFDYSQKDALVNLVVRAIDINDANPDDALFVTFVYTSGTPSPNLALTSMSVDGNGNSTTFAPLGNMTALVDTRAPTSMSNLTRSIQSPGALRSIWYTLSFHNTHDMIQHATTVYDTIVAELADQAPGAINVIFVYQPLPTQFATRVPPGTNVLGLDTSLTQNSILFQLQALVGTAEDESRMDARLAEATAEIEAYAKATGQDTPFRYLNYANPSQDPIGSYGAENVAFLREVSAKYDPEGFFQKKVTGGFKL